MGSSSCRSSGNVNEVRKRGLFTLEKKPIGKGGFVKVYKGKSTIEKDSEVVAKVFNKNLMSPDDIQAVKDEVDRLIHLNHSNIVKYLEWYEDK